MMVFRRNITFMQFFLILIHTVSSIFKLHIFEMYFILYCMTKIAKFEVSIYISPNKS